jgi:pimeloyl-ACP methyl ester carboxylesterase
MKTLKFVFITLSCFFAVIYLLIVSYFYFNQEEMIFLPAKLSIDYKFDFKQDFEELNIPSFDNKNLNGLLFKAENSKGLIFYLHGNAGALDTWGDIAENYTNLGYDVFILDYRSYGKSEGTIENEEQFYKDISFAYKKLLARYDENKVVIIGYSIGTGPATYLASKNKPKMLILQAPYYNLTELSDSRVPFMPDFLKKYKFETNVFITKLKSPVFIFHGNKDHVISYSNSVKLSKLLKPNDHFYTLKDQDHSGVNDNQEFLKELKIILEK